MTSNKTKFCEKCKIPHPKTSEYWGNHQGKETYCRVQMRNYKSENFAKIEERYGKKIAAETDNNTLVGPTKRELQQKKKRDGLKKIVELLDSREKSLSVKRKTRMFQTGNIHIGTSKPKKEYSQKLRNWIPEALGNAIKNDSKTGTAVEELGCSIEFLKKYLESQFTEKMNWRNYNKFWHIKYIFPLHSLDLTIQSRRLAACNYRNLRPVRYSENDSKEITVAQKIAFKEIMDLLASQKKLCITG
jgi:hypothetical protein